MLQKWQKGDKCSLSVVLQAHSTLKPHGSINSNPEWHCQDLLPAITTTSRNPLKKKKKVALAEVRDQKWSLTWEQKQLMLLLLLTPEEIFKCIHWWMIALFHFRIIPFREKSEYINALILFCAQKRNLKLCLFFSKLQISRLY